MELDTVQTIILSAAVGALVSLAVEYIRTRRTARFWLAQERWKLKRETYTGLLEVLSDYRHTYRVLGGAAREAKVARPGVTTQLMRQTSDLLAGLPDVRRRLGQWTSKARLWVKGDALAAIRDLEEGLSTAAAAGFRLDEVQLPERWEALLKVTQDIDAVIERAQKALAQVARQDFEL